MHRNRTISFRHGLALAALVAAGGAHAQSYALRLHHDSTVVGTDGVTRIVRFDERLVRKDGDVWLERIVPDDGAPAGASDAQAGQGAPAAGHPHRDTASAVRWVRRDAHGALQVRLVDRHDRLLIDVPRSEYANIGFDGNWVRASQLLDPAVVATMAPMARASQPGTRWRESRHPGGFVRVLWDEGRAVPLKIESQHDGGRRRSTMDALVEPLPAVLPWARLDGYADKDYSDLLD